MTAPVGLLQSLVERVEAGIPCALCVVVGTHGSTPQSPGAMLLLLANSETEGTIGGGCVEAEVRRHALALLASQSSGLLAFELDRDYGWDDGLICGGRMEVAVVSYDRPEQLDAVRQAIEAIRRQETARIALRVERDGKTLEYRLNFEPTPTLLIAGAGHVGAALARLAVELDFRVVVIDDRDDLLGGNRLPPPIESAAGAIPATLRQWPIDGNSYVAIVTRGHIHDAQSLQAVIDSPAKYVGMIGSRRKIAVVFDELESRGVQRARLEQVHTPIGLAIGAVTVPEIAVSIAAELIQVRRHDSARAVEGPIEISATPGSSVSG
jgi:xanthine dehydrogenase accessory factor